MENTVDKVIITVVGKDTVGIIAKVCTYLSENHINVLDISQTIVSGFFNMMMIVDMSQSSRFLSGTAQKDLDGGMGSRSVCPSNVRRKRFLKKCTESRKMCRKIDRWT